MSRRLALYAVLAALAAYGASVFIRLHAVFAAERAQAELAVHDRRVALDAFAARAFEDRLADRLAAARPRIDAAEADPLAPVEGLYRRRGPRLTVPPAVDHAERGDAAALYDALRGPGHPPPIAARPGDAWAERLAHHGAALDAVAADDRAALTGATRRLLAHRARHQLGPARDVPATLAALALLVDHADPDPALLRAVLHDGIGDGLQHIEGIQRTLLRHRLWFTADDFDRLADETERLSRRGQVPRAAFTRARTPPPPPAIAAHPSAPTLTPDGNWYAEPAVGDPGRVDGVRVDALAERAAVEQAMRQGGLLTPDERVTLDPAAPVPVAVASPEWTLAPARARETWRLKLVLLWLCAGLALAAAALVLFALRRRRRYIELKSDFIAAVSHELRTPLAAIRLMAETLERRLVDTPRARDYPARIVREADHLGYLVENILSYSRIDKGRWVARPQPVPLGDLVSRVRESMHIAFPDRTLRWQLDGVDEITLHADPTLAELLLTNLIRNAIQHHHGDAVTLTLRGITRDFTHVIRITDDGPGVPADAIPHIFDPFYRADAAQPRGSGLGLALCRRITTLHHGALELARTGPDGTTFEARFPRALP